MNKVYRTIIIEDFVKLFSSDPVTPVNVRTLDRVSIHRAHYPIILETMVPGSKDFSSKAFVLS